MATHPQTAFPAPGALLTYAEAFRAYDELESYMLSCVYTPSFTANVKMYDLMWHINDVAAKYGLDEKRAFTELRDLMYSFSTERTALANGVNGKRFRLLGDTSALVKHDETHLFEVGIDGAKLRQKFDAFMDVLAKESAGRDEYADTYSPDWPVRASAPKKKDLTEKVLLGCLLITTSIFVLSMVAHAIFGFGGLASHLM